MRIVDTGPLQRGDHAVELRDAGHGSDAYSVHSAAGDLIVAPVVKSGGLGRFTAIC